VWLLANLLGSGYVPVELTPMATTPSRVMGMMEGEMQVRMYVGAKVCGHKYLKIRCMSASWEWWR
jgi:hypothetical protein